MKIVTLFAMPGGTELIIILAVVVLMFGGRKIPELMKGIGKGIREYKNGLKGVTDFAKKIKD